MDINGRMYGLIISEGQTYLYSIQALGSVSHQKNYFAKKKSSVIQCVFKCVRQA